MFKYKDSDLYEALKELGVVDEKILTLLYERTQKSKASFYMALLSEGLITEENLGKTLANLLGLPYIQLSQTIIDDAVLKKIPFAFAKKQRMIVFRIEEGIAHVATSRPDNHMGSDYLQRILSEKIKLYFCTDNEIGDALLLYQKKATLIFQDIIDKSVKQAKNDKTIEPPIIQIVDTIIEYAVQKKTSDIHIEPTETSVLVRFRIDGILHDIVKLPLDLHERIITRIKVMSNLRTDEHQKPLDGKIRWVSQETDDKTLNNKIDIRISIVPSVDGEKVVMRILSDQSRQLSLTNLGLSPSDLKKVKEAYHRPQGLILSTGPTGSGKTTSMYSILKLLNKREVNVATIEDPVEYDLEGITQIQVNKKTELTFAKGLRSIVRQDPDIVLVGEIRDGETASIAINAAMTGHLVLSTLHTNDAATTVPRLIDMGIEPYLLASTINVIVAQRLVRKIHNKCMLSQDLEIEKLKTSFEAKTLSTVFGEKQKIRTYKGKGCKICQQTGYQGRIGIYEVLVIDDEIRQAIVDKKDASVINDLAIKNGMKSMTVDGLEKIKQGITTIDELMRVTRE
jgi:type IV pilus assembly protein PilB